MPHKSATNAEISALLDHIANLLEAKGENPFRVRSYRRGAESIRESKESVSNLVASGGGDRFNGIEGIGEKLAGLIQEYVETGNVEMLASLEKEVPEEQQKPTPTSQSRHEFASPLNLSVKQILAVDEEYRKKATAGKLKIIAPKKLNPEGRAWLPILVIEHDGYKFTVMFSNTQTAHELKKTNDWVVVYYERGKGENQCTVVTETRGVLKGKRVIRGREGECRKYYSVA